MARFLFPIILIAIAVTSFFTYTNPAYSGAGGINDLKAQYQKYDEALSNAKTLKELMGTLAKKRADINPSDLDRLNKLLPDSVNNVRLVLDLNALGAPIGVSIDNVKFEEQKENQGSQDPRAVAESKKDYGTFNIDFSISGTYPGFVNFLGQLDQSLRLLDVSSITFATTDTKDVYRYDFKVKTYWLKN